jgi:hypothetical protein
MPDETMTSNPMDSVKKSGRPGRPPKARVSAPPAKKIESSREATKETRPQKKKGKSALIYIALIIIASGAVYAWQSSQSQTLLSQFKEKSEEVKGDLEKKLSVMDNELKGLQKENDTLKSSNTELEGKAKLLSDAKKEFSNSELGIEFEYPAEYGDVNFEFKNGDAGRMFTGTFSNNDALAFGGVSADFQSKTAPDFLGFQGAEKKKEGTAEKLMAKWIGGSAGSEFEIKPQKSFADIQIVVASSLPAGSSGTGTPQTAKAEEAKPDGGAGQVAGEEASGAESASASDSKPAGVAPGENEIGALITLKKDKFKGLAFWDKNAEKIPSDVFEKLVKGIIVK